MSSEATGGSSLWYDFLAWAETNKRTLIVAGIAVVVLVFAVAIYRWKVRETERAASEALIRLKATAPADGASEPAAGAADYLKIAREHSGTAAAERALILGAGALFTDGKYAEAQAEFEKILRERSGSLLAPSAAYGVATSLEAQGKKDEALTAYQNVSARYPKSALVDSAKMAIARIYEAKSQPELALKTYEEMTRPGDTGAAVTQAMQHKQRLLAAHPELARTNAPPAAVTPDPVATPVGNP